MEEYPTFSLPELINIPLVIIVTMITVTIAFLVFYLLWDRRKKLAFPRVAGVASLLGIVVVVLAFTLGQQMNDKALNKAIEQDYGVKISSSLPENTRLILAKSEIYECRINSKDDVNYYILCDTGPRTNVSLHHLTK